MWTERHRRALQHRLTRRQVFRGRSALLTHSEGRFSGRKTQVKLTDQCLLLARRFFRLFKWVDCWNLAHREYEAGPLYPHLLPSSSSTSGSVAGRASARDYTAAAPEESGQKAWPTANEIRNKLEDETGVMNDSSPSEDAGTMSGKVEGEGEEPKVHERANDGDEIYTMLAVLKWSLLGMYFLMEMWTIVSTHPLHTLLAIYHGRPVPTWSVNIDRSLHSLTDRCYGSNVHLAPLRHRHARRSAEDLGLRNRG